jgi:hypothetical protein
MLFRKIIPVYSESHAKPLTALCGQTAEVLNVKLVGTDSCHLGLKG